MLFHAIQILVLLFLLVLPAGKALAQATPPTINCAAPVTINTTAGLCTGTTILTPPVVSFNSIGGLFGNALAFDGVNDYVSAPRTVQDDFTIEFWFSSTQNAGSASQYHNGRGMVDASVIGVLGDFGVSLGAGKVLFGIGGIVGVLDDVTINSGVALNDGLWHHVAATRTRSTGVMNLYINGVLVSTGIGSTQSLNVPLNIRIGSLLYSGAAFSGKMDEVRIWNTVRTQAQISENMNAPLSGLLPPDLVTYYKLNSGTANSNNAGVVTAFDETGNSNGTLNNFALSGSSSNWVLYGESITNNALPFYPIGNTTVTWSATNTNGNTATCNQVVTVVDNQPPVITCIVPGINISKGISSGGTATIVGYAAFNGAYLYGGPSLGLGISCNEAYTPFGTLCDEAPNTDNPAASTKTTNESGATWEEYYGAPVGEGVGVLVIDLGSVQTFSRAQVFQMGSDGKVTHIQGFYHPSTSASPPLYSDSGWEQMFAETYVNDGVLNGNTVTSPTTINFTPKNARYVKYYVRNDGSYGGEGLIQLRSVKLFNPSSDITAYLPSGVCSMPVNFSRTVTDNCPGTVVTYSPASGSVFCAGVTPVTVTATDVAGNRTTCTLNVSVVTTGVLPCVPPEINVTGNAVTILDGDATATATDGTDFGQAGPSVPLIHTFTIENNGAAPLIISSLSISGTIPSNFTIGGISLPLTLASAGSTSFTVTFSASSEGNYNAIMNINNNDCDELLYDFALHAEVSSCQPAAFSACPANKAANTASNSCNAVVTYTSTVTGTPVPAITYSLTGVTTGSGSGNGSGSSFNKGTTTVTLTATNSCGTATCSFDVVVTDVTPPTLNGTLPGGQTGMRLCFANIPSGPTVATIAAFYTDNCGTVNVTKTGAPTGNNNSWTVTYHYVIKDGYDNVATAVDISYSGGTVPTGNISGAQGICSLPGLATYSIAPVAGASSYNWSVSSPAMSISSGQGTTTIIVNYSNSFSAGSICVAAVFSICTGPSTCLTIVKNKPGNQGVISGPQSGVCLSTRIYSIVAVAGASSYDWGAPIGASIVSGQGTTSVTVSFSNTFTSGNLKVRAINECGNGPWSPNLAISAIGDPGPISGSESGVCNSIQIYSIAAVAGATSYNWSAPRGSSIISGQGTPSISLSFSNSFNRGNLKVEASNACGTSAWSNNLSITDQPADAGPISGPLSGVCGSTRTYSITALPGVTSYNWSVPTGASILNGQGTTSINVQFGNGFTNNGTITVSAHNACGDGKTASITVTAKTEAPAFINGSTSPCKASTQTYFVDPIAGASTYDWVVPNGYTIVSGLNTRSIIVLIGTANGQIKVRAVNSCGNSPWSNSLNINPVSCFSRSDVEPGNRQVIDQISVQVSPNPSNGDFILQVTSKSHEPVTVRIMDMNGVVKSVSLLNSKTRTLKAGSNLLAGTYMAEVIQGSIRKVVKLVKLN